MAVRISADEARQHVASGQALLVCAYDDEQKCSDTGVQGALTHKQFQAQLTAVPMSREIIFFCA